MSNIIQTFPKGGSPTYSGLPDKPTVNNIDIETLSIEGMDVADNGGTTEISAPGLNADSLADVTSGEVNNYAVTGGNTYSTSEQIIGRWLDGKPLYQVTINFGAGPVAGQSKTVQANIANIDKIIDYKGISISNGGSVSLPFVHPTGLHYAIQLDTRNKTASKIDVLVNTGTEMSLTASNIYVTLQYTKTTDT